MTNHPWVKLITLRPTSTTLMSPWEQFLNVTDKMIRKQSSNKKLETYPTYKQTERETFSIRSGHSKRHNSQRIKTKATIYGMFSCIFSGGLSKKLTWHTRNAFPQNQKHESNQETRQLRPPHLRGCEYLWSVIWEHHPPGPSYYGCVFLRAKGLFSGAKALVSRRVTLKFKDCFWGVSC